MQPLRKQHGVDCPNNPGASPARCYFRALEKAYQGPTEPYQSLLLNM
jgi:hypothetical protein